MERPEDLAPTELAYAAGVFDARGALLIARARRPDRRFPQYILMLRLGFADRRPAAWLAGRFGGRVRALAGTGPGRPTVHAWEIDSRSAAQFLRRIAPYAISRREQIALALEFQATLRRGRRVDAALVELWEGYKARLAALRRPPGTRSSEGCDGRPVRRGSPGAGTSHPRSRSRTENGRRGLNR